MPKPMLAKTWDPDKHSKLYPVYVQPKLDGMRCLAFYKNPGRPNREQIILLSRNQKEFYVPHLIDDIHRILSIHPFTILDGELYAHLLSFQEVASRIKRQNHPDQKIIEYRVYDFIPADYNSKLATFTERNSWLQAAIRGSGTVRSVKTLLAVNQEMLDRHHRDFVTSGYEGSMIRDRHSPYKEGERSPGLLKRKDFLEEEFRIVDVVEGEGKNKGTAVFVCCPESQGKTEYEKEFTCTAHGDYAEKAEIWKNRTKYVARKLTVKFQEYSDTGIPRFPVAIGIKEDR